MKSNVCCQCRFYVRKTDYGGNCRCNCSFVYGGKIACENFCCGESASFSDYDEEEYWFSLDEIEEKIWDGLL